MKISEQIGKPNALLSAEDYVRIMVEIIIFIDIYEFFRESHFHFRKILRIDLFYPFVINNKKIF